MLLVVQALPKVAPAFVHLPTCVHCDAIVHAVLGGARLLVQTPTLSQKAFVVQSSPSLGESELVHFDGPAAAQLALTLQALPVFEQVPVCGQAAALAQVVAGALLHLLVIAGQVATVVHAAFGGLLQVPGTNGQVAEVAQAVFATAQRAEIAGQEPGFDVQTALGGLLQLPAGGQVLTPALIVQACPVLLQVPPVIGQSVLTLQEPLDAPWQRLRLQSELLAQLLAATLHVPLTNGHSALLVQVLLVWMLHLPANVDGGQVVV